MKYYFATGNNGDGSGFYVFRSAEARDFFVASDKRYGNKSAISQAVAEQQSKDATLLSGDIKFKMILADLKQETRS